MKLCKPYPGAHREHVPVAYVGEVCPVCALLAERDSDGRLERLRAAIIAIDKAVHGEFGNDVPPRLLTAMEFANDVLRGVQ